MLLSWVLTRDIESVLSMADEYGGWRIENKGAVRIQPLTLDDVLRAHTIDDSLPEDERVREAVRRAESLVIPARQEIFGALRSGAIEGFARPNGSGDLIKIEAIQWAGLRFRSIGGHDFAIPINNEAEPLNLPKPLVDYLSGIVPAALDPTVWPDPLFPADQAMSLWPAIGDPVQTGSNTPGSGAQAVSALEHGGIGIKGSGRRPSREKPFWSDARVAAIEWLSDSGCPRVGDGNQALLEKFVAEWVENQGHEAGESTVRRHVRRWISEHRATLNL